MTSEAPTVYRQISYVSHLVRFTLVSAVCFALTLVASVAHARSKPVTPESGELLTLVIAGKHSAYFLLPADSSLYLTLTGPGTLTGIMRLITPTVEDIPATYTTVVSDGDRLVKTLNSTTSPSEWHWLGNDDPVGKSRKFHVRLKEGKHRIKIALMNTSAKGAGVRFLYNKTSPHVGESQLYPLSMREQATFQVRESALDYAIMDADTPVTVRVFGPTRLRIVSRLLYSGLMKGPKQYSIVSKMDGKALPVKSLSTEKSFTTEIVNHDEWIAGKSKTFYLPIPKGEHIVSFRMTAIDAPGVALRFTIPKEDMEG